LLNVAEHFALFYIIHYFNYTDVSAACDIVVMNRHTEWLSTTVECLPVASKSWMRPMILLWVAVFFRLVSVIGDEFDALVHRQVEPVSLRKRKSTPSSCAQMTSLSRFLHHNVRHATIQHHHHHQSSSLLIQFVVLKWLQQEQRCCTEVS